jgi:type III pantothenate kinase
MINASLDFGNTRIKIGLFKDQQLEEIVRLTTIAETQDYLISKKIKNVIVSSVTYPKKEIYETFSFVENLVFLDFETPLPIINNYESPKTLGYDRVAAAIGANIRFPNQNCLVIDIGTALKYDFVSDKNAFEGGIISLGRRMRFNALHTFTKKLPLLDTVEIPDLIGQTTESCMHSGVMNGIVAEINGIIEQYLKKFNFQVIITGGDAGLFESRIKYPTFAAPNLVLEGLNRILSYNVK